MPVFPENSEYSRYCIPWFRRAFSAHHRVISVMQNNSSHLSTFTKVSPHLLWFSWTEDPFPLWRLRTWESLYHRYSSSVLCVVSCQTCDAKETTFSIPSSYEDIWDALISQFWGHTIANIFLAVMAEYQCWYYHEERKTFPLKSKFFF